MTINFIAMGKLKESWYREACAEYSKRIGAYASVKLIEPAPVELPKDPSDALIEKALEREAELIAEHIKSPCYTIAMCVEGKSLSSERLAEHIADITNRGISTLNFIVGSSYGLAESLKRSADLRLSMSPMTFPHSLARVMLFEQVYRAFTILNNAKYHK